jgi:hypothetical protein
VPASARELGEAWFPPSNSFFSIKVCLVGPVSSRGSRVKLCAETVATACKGLPSLATVGADGKELKEENEGNTLEGGFQAPPAWEAALPLVFIREMEVRRPKRLYSPSPWHNNSIIKRYTKPPRLIGRMLPWDTGAFTRLKFAHARFANTTVSTAFTCTTRNDSVICQNWRIYRYVRKQCPAL